LLSVTSAVSSRDVTSGGQKAAWRFEDAIWVLILPILLPLVVVFSLQIYAGLGLLPGRWLELMSADSRLALVVQYFFSLMIYGAVIGWLVWRRRARWQDLGVKTFQPRWLAVVGGLYIVQVIAMIAVFALVELLLPQVNLDEKQSVLEFGLQGWGWWLSFVSTVVIAPVLEEIMFRGIMFTALTSRWRVWLAAIVSSLAFAFLHGQVNVGIYTFIFGLLLCWLYRKSRSIVPGIILHFLNNLVAFWLLSQAVT